MKRFDLIKLMMAITVLSNSAYADVPKLINYQGMLKNGAGNPVANGSYSVTFRIYDAPAGGSTFWTETQSVTTTSGLFAVILGSISPVPDSAFKDTTRYLSIAVSPDPELSPRQRLVSVGYSYRVGTVDGASGGTITSRVSIGPGHTNTGVNAFVAGENSTASGDNSTIGGGDQNTASDACAVVGGGGQNTASSYYATVGGGYVNIASGAISIVGGGSNNTASGYSATVGGGLLGTASGYSATVSGGSNNTASGIYATVPGGEANSAVGYNSFAAGDQAKSLHDGTFVWSDGNNDSPFSSTKANQFLIHADSGVGIGTNAPSKALEVVGSVKVSDTLFASNVSSLSPLRLQTAGTTRMYIDDASGNVGVGTTSPSSNLEVVGDLEVSGNIIGSTPWTAFPFAAGYQDYEDGHPGTGYQRVQYRKIGDVVYLRGRLHKADHGLIPAATLGTLPVGFRPPAGVNFALYTGGFVTSVDVGPDGVVASIWSNGDYFSLDGISFSTIQ